MVSSVPTYASAKTLFNNMRETSKSLNMIAEQLTSGYTANVFSKLENVETTQLMSSFSTINEKNQYQHNISTLNSRLSFMDNSFTSINELINQFNTALNSQTAITLSPTLQNQATTILSIIQSYINQQDKIRYVFGGSQTTTQQPMKDITASIAKYPTQSGNLDQGTIILTTNTNPLPSAALPTLGSVIHDANNNTATVSGVTRLNNGNISLRLRNVQTGFASSADSNGTPSSPITMSSSQGIMNTSNQIIGASIQTFQSHNLIPPPTLNSIAITGTPTGGQFAVGDIVRDQFNNRSTVQSISYGANGLVRLYLGNQGGLSVAHSSGSILTNLTTTGVSMTGMAQEIIADNYMIIVSSLNSSAKVGDIIQQGTNQAVIVDINTNNTNSLITLRAYTPNTKEPQSSVFTNTDGIITNYLTGIEISKQPTDYIPPDTTTSYYTNLQAAADIRQSTKIDDQTTVFYGITADNPCFEQFIRVLNFFKDTPVPNSGTPDFNQYSIEAERGIATLIQASKHLQQAQFNNAFNINMLSNIEQQNTLTLKISQDLQNSIIQTDMTTAVAALQSLQLSLKATFSVTAMLKNLTLSAYI